MRWLKLGAAMVSMLAVAGCGFGGIREAAAAGFIEAFRQSGGLGACLEVTNDAAEGLIPIIAVSFEDPVTGETVGYRPVTLHPGEDVDLMDLPEGSYRVRARYEDGRWSPEAPALGIPVTLIHDVDTGVVFAHP